MLDWSRNRSSGMDITIFIKRSSIQATAWLYGASGVNCSLLGIGERTGNTPLEAMVIEYAQLRGTLDGMDTTVIREIADYYENEIGYKIPEKTPFVGRDFNTTQAGIHADGLMKDERIYNIFDTTALLDSPPSVSIAQTSGLTGVACWLNSNVKSAGPFDKNDERVAKLKGWVDQQYAEGRCTVISHQELMQAVHLLNLV